MNMQTSLFVMSAIVVGGLECLNASENNNQQPNILVIVSDNQGWKDIGYNGSEIRTPHLDRLAANGVRLDQFYVYPMCSPTRVALISGRAPSRYSIDGAIGQRSRQALPPDTVTLADTLKESGYQTAITGKWHLGLRPEVGPLQYGFGYSYGFLHGQIDKYTHRYKNGDRSWHRNDQFIDETGHSLDLIAGEAVKFIERKRNKPFFLYVPFGSPHPPLQEEQKWVESYEGKIPVLSRRLYAASVTHMDAVIGQLINALNKTGQRDDTIVVFFSDNGAIQNWPLQPKNYEGRFGPYPVLGDNGPLRGWIGDLYEGCVRTPALVNWPKVLQPMIVNQVTSVLDLYPTLVSLAKGHVSKEWNLEGRNVWPLLSGQGKVNRIQLYWKHSSGKQFAVRDGDWKFVLDRRTSDAELFNISKDPYEKHNLADAYPDKVKGMHKLLEQQVGLDP